MLVAVVFQLFYAVEQRCDEQAASGGDCVKQSTGDFGD